MDGVVLDRRGRPAKVAIAEARERGSEQVSSWTDVDPRDGSFRLRIAPGDPTGVYYVRAVDPSTGDASGSAELCAADDEGAATWLPLRLQETFVMQGTVVSRSGAPLPGRRVRIEIDGAASRTCPLSGSREELDAVTDTIGRFGLRVRRGCGTGRIAIRAADGAWGWPLEYIAPEEPSLDVGRIVDPTGQSVSWRICIRSADGAPCGDAVVKLLGDDLWNATSHPSFDASAYWIRSDGSGVVKLRLACRPSSAILAVGGPRYGTQGLVLDCSRPGEREVVVRLRARPSARLRLVGDAAPALIAMGGTVTFVGEPLDRTTRKDVECIDALTGSPASIPRSRGRAPPTDLLESAVSGIRWSVARLSSDTFEVRVPEPGDYQVSVGCGRDGWFLFSQRVRIADDVPGQTIEVPVPAGRRAVLDVTDVDRWAESEVDGVWLSRYQAWPRVPDRTPSEIGALPEFHGAVELLSVRERRGAQRVELWLPAGTTAVAFGFLEGRVHDAHSSGAALREIPAAEVASIRAPAPPVSWATVAISLRRRGQPTRQAGIDVEFVRVGGRLDHTVLRTDENGVVTAHLLEGTYTAHVGSAAVNASPVQFEVRPGGESLEVPLDWDFAVE